MACLCGRESGLDCFELVERLKNLGVCTSRAEFYSLGILLGYQEITSNALQ